MSRHDRERRKATWIAAVAILSSTTAFGQLTRTSEQINVSVIEVEATVLDSSGKFVPGLKQGDFELRVGGRKTRITNFYEVNRRADEAAGAGKNAAAVARRDYLVLFIDDLHLNQHEKKRVLDALRRFATQHIGRGTAAMIVRASNGVRILQKFTEDPAPILAAIDSMEREPARAGEYERERRDVLNFIDDVRNDPKLASLADTIPQRIESLGAMQAHEVEETIAELDQITSAVAGLDGRKVVVYVSDGLPMQPAVEVFHYFNPADFGNDASMQLLQQTWPLDTLGTSMHENYDRLAKQTALAGVQFFAIDAGGVRSYGEGVESSAGSSRLDSSLMRSNLHAPIQFVADETGGQAIIDTNDMNLAFSELDDHLSSYYSLGFRSEASDRDVEIQVTVRRPGATVRAARHVRQRTAREQIADRVRSALYSRIEENPLEVRLSVMPLKATSGVKATIGVPVTKLSILPQGSAYGASFSVFVAMIDDKDRETPVRMFVRRLAPSETAEADQTLTLETEPGTYTVSFAITDSFSLETTYLQREVTVAK